MDRAGTIDRREGRRQKKVDGVEGGLMDRAAGTINRTTRTTFLPHIVASSRHRGHYRFGS